MSISMQKQDKKCRSDEVIPRDVKVAARLIARVFLGGDGKVYGPIDRLALATSTESILVALYEIDRGVRSEIGDIAGDEGKIFSEVIAAIASDARSTECLEKALQLAHELAVKALALSKEELERGGAA